MITIITVTFLTSVLYASFFEWLLHRFIMHRPFFGFTYPFDRHARVHHRIFRADATYHLQQPQDASTIPMAWWNALLLIPVASLPFCIASWLSSGWTTWLTSLVTISAYYGAYEYLHWCMHLPKSRRLEFSWVFRKLNGHHVLHHRYMESNFNVVLPLADLCLGTLLLRSRIDFPQVRGPMVPNLQPRDGKTRGTKVAA